ncbi:Bcccg2 [Botrytis cinerea B05.10]|uniref:Bcccg2 n=1 Tax=Botryotinia fuckeliana (strain B05.10) TaxID=332648 RepID=A0A384JFI6_BOTFB|nr:Bcccg2 [Botrytis cinerea B05.10]ATZ49232.1 Bcccg2 [Botrytis cinerea B05.10]
MTCLPNFIRNGFSFHSPRYINLFFVPPFAPSSTLIIYSSTLNPQEPLINLFNQPPLYNHTMSLHYLPPVKPSAIALGTVFNHAASLAILGPVFGETYHRAQAANSKEEFIKSKEAASAAAAWGTSLVGSAVQSYGVGALINATGTLSYKGAAYLGSLIFMASSAPSFIAQITTEKRPLDTVAVGALARVFETVGLSLFLTWWGTHTNPFE